MRGSLGEAMAPIFRSEPGSFYLKLKNLNYTALDKGERTGKETGKKTGKEFCKVRK